MDASRKPEPGDLYAIPDDAGRWLLVLRFVRWADERRGVGEFESDSGEAYTVRVAQLVPLRAVDARDAREPADVLDDRLYRRRARVTAQQRANRKLTEKQRRRLFALARNRGMDVDDLRAMTPQGSISKLTVREAGEVIDRLLGVNASGHRGAQSVG